MASVELWFPVAVYTEENLISVEQNELLKQHCLSIQAQSPSGGSEWMGGTYNTHGTHDLSNDAVFQPVLDQVAYHVHQFAKMHNCDASYANNYAWMNIATGKDWQEFHTHNGNVFSAVYYVTAPEGSGRIVFEDPKEPDMCPLKTKGNRNKLSYSRVGYTPKDRMLVIFRSYLRHLVEQGSNTEPRISIAMNFN